MSKHRESGLVMNIIRIYHKIQKRLGSVLSAHGIGLTEYLVLNELYITPMQKMRRCDLAEQVGLSPSGITRLINPMEKIGLVVKEENPRDARVSLVVLSDTGKQIYEEAQITFAHASAELFKGFETEQLDALGTCICKKTIEKP
jgi:DNA-binding MarR family transcriptional regulator